MVELEVVDVPKSKSSAFGNAFKKLKVSVTDKSRGESFTARYLMRQLAILGSAG